MVNLLDLITREDAIKESNGSVSGFRFYIDYCSIEIAECDVYKIHLIGIRNDKSISTGVVKVDYRV